MKKIAIFFFMLSSVLTANEYHYDYGTIDEVKGIIPASMYGEVVNHLPICCVDVFIVDRKSERYLLIERNTPPAKGLLWYPGGRMFKEETFYQCAVRKAVEETNLRVEPLEVLGVYSTVFPDSAWGCSTHTVNIAVFAEYLGGEAALDEHHDGHAWMPLKEAPGDGGYLDDVFYKAHRS